MKFYGKKRGGRRVYKSKARVARRAGKGKRMSFAKRVKAVMASDIETKRTVYSSTTTAFNQAIANIADGLRLMPAISNGTGNNQRIGNVIKLQGIKVRGVLTFTLGQTTAANTRIGVRVFVLRAKRFKNWQDTQNDLGTGYTRLLEGTLTGMDGSLAAFNTPTNPDYYSVVMDKRFYMSQSTQQAGIATPGQPQVSETTKFLNFTVPYSKRKIHYDENYSLTDPVDFPYVICVSYTKLGGEAPDAPAAAYLTFQYTATADFEDA